MLDAFAPRDPETTLRRLHRLLSLNGVGSWVFLPIFFLSFGVGFHLVKLIVLVAVPYVGWLLWQAQWRGWLVALAVVTIGSMLAFWTWTPSGYLAAVVFEALPMLCILMYTSMLEYAVADWLRDREALHRFEQDDLQEASSQAGTPA